MLATLAACASSPKGVVTANCVSDPPNFLEIIPELKGQSAEQVINALMARPSFQCISRDGVEYAVSWKESENYICRPPEDDKQLNLKAHH